MSFLLFQKLYLIKFDGLSDIRLSDPENYSGKKENFTYDDLVQSAKNIVIKKPNELIEQVVDSVSRFERITKIVGVPKHQIDAIKKTHLVNINKNISKGRTKELLM